MRVRLTDVAVTWRRSARGNLSRKVGRFLVTVFAKGWGYRWSVADGRNVRYSAETWPTEGEAKDDAMRLFELDLDVE